MNPHVATQTRLAATSRSWQAITQVGVGPLVLAPNTRHPHPIRKSKTKKKAPGASFFFSRGAGAPATAPYAAASTLAG